MAKTYTCNLCPGKMFADRSALKRHEKWDNDHAQAARLLRERQAAERKAQQEIEGAHRVWAYAHASAFCTGHWDGLRKAVDGGMSETLAYALQTQNDRLADDLKELAKEAERLQDVMKRDVLDRIADAGVCRIYGSGTSTSSMHDVQVAEGKVIARADALRSLASALGVRCQATYAPSEWSFLQAVAQFEIEASGDAVELVNGTYGVRERFETRDAAVLECVRRARQAEQQIREAAEVK